MNGKQSNILRQLQEQHQKYIIQKYLKRKHNHKPHNQPDPVHNKLYVDWQDSQIKSKSRIRTQGSIKSRHTKYLYEANKIIKQKDKKKHNSVQLPRLMKKVQFSPRNQQSISSGRKSDIQLYLWQKRQKNRKSATVFEEKNSINVPIYKNKIKNINLKANTNKIPENSNLLQINEREEDGKNLNVRQKVKMKLQKQREKHKLRKHMQWEEVDILKMQTYFGKLKKVGSKINSNLLQNSQSNNVKQIASKELKFPDKQKIPQFIRQYKPKNKQIDVDELIKKQSFHILFEDENFLYFGQVKDNEKDGSGVFVSKKYMFEGKWKNDRKVQGVQITSKGSYKGSFKSNKRHGQGQFYWENGESYSGQWQQGFKHGSGVWKSGRGDIYIGQWKNGKVNGYGAHITNIGQKYEGQFQNFLKHGSGKEQFPNGDYFEGTYKNGKPNGQGKYVWKNDITYKGNFVDGYRHGKGEILAQNYLRFKGEFERDFPESYGEIIYANGNEFKGNFVSGQKQGKGIMNLRTEKKVLTGIWKENEYKFKQQQG